ncbi:MAG: agarase [Verrucomicrobiota bacterium]
MRFSMLVAFIVCTMMAHATEPLKVEVKRKPADKNWKIYDTRTLSHAADFKPRTEAAKLSPYGGDASRQFEATKFFHTKKVGERWWLVDPSGNPFVHIAMCSVSPTTGSDEAKAAFKEKFGSEQTWAKKTVELVKSNGFNGSGSWSKDDLLAESSERIAYCPNWNFMSSYGKQRGGTFQKSGHTGYPNNAIFVFDPEFEVFAMQHAAKLAATKDDPWLVGHFSDNELPLYKNSIENFLGLPSEDHGYKAAKKWLEERKEGKSDLEWITDEDREAFIEFYMDRYFSIVSKAIKAHDPNHLYLGCRYHGPAIKSPGAFRAAGNHCDVVSVNYYNVWTPNPEQIKNWQNWSGKPFMITEFYAKGMDSGMPNTSGAGWLVKTQQDRGRFYQNFCIALLESKGCVGWHHFKYQDNDMNNKNVDPSNTDSNKGVVTSNFEPYPEFLQIMKELNLNVYDLMKWMDAGGRVNP